MRGVVDLKCLRRTPIADDLPHALQVSLVVVLVQPEVTDRRADPPLVLIAEPPRLERAPRCEYPLFADHIRFGRHPTRPAPGEDPTGDEQRPGENARDP